MPDSIGRPLAYLNIYILLLKSLNPLTLTLGIFRLFVIIFKPLLVIFITDQAWLIGSLLSARIYFELSGNSN